MIEIGKIKEGMTGRQVADLLYENFLAVISGLGEYATEKWVLDKGYITASALSGYATEQWVTGIGYITASAVAERYATITSVNELAGGVSASLAAVDASLAAVDASLAERVEKTKFAEYFSTEMAKWFVKDDTNKGIKPVNSYGLYSDTYVSAKGVSTGISGGGSGTSYDRLDSWAEYTSAKAGYVLSALLGYDLHTRVNSLANAGYITASALSGYAKLSDIPTSLPASDVYSWAKAASKPSYAFSEINNKPTTLGGYGITDAYTATTIDGKLSGYLPLSGGMITGGFGIHKNNTTENPNIALSNNNGTAWLGYNVDADSWFVTNKNWFNTYTILHSGNIGSQSVASAAKLTTPRSIWGQSFDGTGNVSGALDNCNWVRYYKGGNVSGYMIGRGEEMIVGGDGLGLWTYGNTPIFFGTGSVERMRITNAGNVLIGTTSGIGHSQAKLQVYESSNEWGSVVYTNKSSVMSSHVGGYGMLVTSVNNNNSTYLLSVKYNDTYLSGEGNTALLVKDNGNVLIGTTADNGTKLQVNYTSLYTGIEVTKESGNEASIGFKSDVGRSVVGIWGSGLNLWNEGLGTALTIPVSSNNVLIGTAVDNGARLQVGGSVVASGSVTAKSSSDYRLKCEFDYNVDYQERLLSLGKVCDFNYTPHAQAREFAFADDKRHTSVIWQDARKANITGFCSVEEDGYGTINPLSSDLIFTMVGAIQQGITKTEKIEERVVRLEKENRELKEKINLLEGGRYGC